MFNSALRRRVEVLEDQLAEMQEAHERVVNLEADWQDWLHKIRNVLARLNQRAKSDPDFDAPPGRAMNPAAARLLGLNGRE